MAEINKSNPENEIARDVFDVKDVRAKTELRIDQIESVNKLNTLASVFGSGLLQMHVRDFMVLQKSKDRQSMGEFVTALRSKKEELIEKGKMFFNNLMG